jgi:hypothetical protein
MRRTDVVHGRGGCGDTGSRSETKNKPNDSLHVIVTSIVVA